MDERVHVLGIRHHGPGSAASTLQALEALDPACVLIEGPPEADEILPLCGAPGMRPPLAILVYPRDEPEAARFDPFAEYSPEWCALRWAVGARRPVRFVDLPMGTFPAQRETADPAGTASEEAPLEDTEAELPEVEPETEIQRDPLSLLAEAAGHSDGEAWWNAIVEQQVSAPAVFHAIHGAMAALREAEPDLAQVPRDGRDDLQREAFMRQQIRAALGEFEGDIAVVCGAWHAPALLDEVSASADRSTLKGFKRAKTETCWIPWTDRRLAMASGYGAGVISPGWYRHLWETFQTGGSGATHEAVARWQGAVAARMRDAGQPISTASVIDATRLALSLASLRDRPVPGLAEMRDASLATLCGGEPALLTLVDTQVITGERVGEVDESVPQPPLQADLARQQKKLRLKPEATEKDVSFDLRSGAGMAKSELLHRLQLIDVPWGRLIDASAGRGTFREVWRLAWDPELSVKLAEAVVWGPTIAQAATGCAMHTAREERDTGALAELVRASLLANLREAAEAGIARMQAVAVASQDIPALMRAVSPLVEVLRYGTARELPEDALRGLVESLVVEVCTGFAAACRRLDADVAAELVPVVRGYDRSVGLLDVPALLTLWHRSLAALAADDDAAAGLRGLAQRILYDCGAASPEDTELAFSRSLSRAVPAAPAGAWLEGFLEGAGDVLLHDPQLLRCVDTWIDGQRKEDFQELLPLLRRAFSGFDASLRQRLMGALGKLTTGAGTTPAAASPSSLDPGAEQAFARAWPLIETILGLDERKETPP